MKVILKIIVLLISCYSFAQQRITADELIAIALDENYQNTINEAEVQKARMDRAGAVEFPKTGVFVENEDFQPSNRNGVWKVGLEQKIPWPGLNKARKNYMDQLISASEFNREIIRSEIRKDVRKSYYQLWYLESKKRLFLQLDSIYQNMLDAATVRYNTGDAPGLDKLFADVKFKKNKALMLQIDQEMLEEQLHLMLLTNRQTYFLPEDRILEKISETFHLEGKTHPLLLAREKNIEVARSMIDVKKQENYPDFSARFFSQKYLGISDPITGFAVSAAIPIFGRKSMKNRVKALESEVELQETQLKWEEMKLENEKLEALTRLEKEKIMLNFYEETGLQQTDAVMKASALSYRAGEISLAEMSQFLTQSIEIRQNYLEAVNQYNQAMIEYQYIANEN